jgi:serine/threonine-protein kinase
VLFELLTGRLPHQGTNAADSVFRLMHEIAPAASSIVPELSPALDDLVACALSKRAEDRFATARAMAEALRATVSRADAHDVADWLSRHLPSEEKRRAERLSRLYAADAAADARATAVPPESKGKSQSPTRIERIDSPVATAPIQSLAVAVAPPIGPKPASLRMPLAVGGVFALLGMLGGAILLRVTPSAGETAHSATPISVSAPPAKDEPIAPQVSASPVASAPAEPSVRRPALHGQLPPSSAAAPPSSAISAPATSAKAPPCCILAGGRWERYSLSPTCVNNCPANVGP